MLAEAVLDHSAKEALSVMQLLIDSEHRLWDDRSYFSKERMACKSEDELTVRDLLKQIVNSKSITDECKPIEQLDKSDDTHANEKGAAAVEMDNHVESEQETTNEGHDTVENGSSADDTIANIEEPGERGKKRFNRCHRLKMQRWIKKNRLIPLIRTSQAFPKTFRKFHNRKLRRQSD